MISNERFVNNIKSINYIEEKQIEGDVVEIGVWKGGSILSMIKTYEKYNKDIRNFHLYDTFEGMTKPLEIDKDLNNNDSSELMKTNVIVKAYSPYEEVYSNIKNNINYDISKIFFHKGDILNNTFYPEKIALLRLDTDWYESTKHELETFYKYVVKGGIIIIDDYGHWKGCKKAVDEFLENYPDIKLFKIDYTGIFFIKP
jgi:O-methyltransferase